MALQIRKEPSNVVRTALTLNSAVVSNLLLAFGLTRNEAAISNDTLPTVALEEFLH
jgi:hypothetical protein